MSAPVGSLTEEALRLFAALSGATAAGCGSANPPDPTGDASPSRHVASDGCPHCTVCRLVAALRATRPEVAAHLEDAAGSLLDALQALRSPGAAAPTPDPGPQRRVEIIDVT